MAGINVNQITSMLAKLQPDSALQNYAQMHKNDPYIVSLVMSESNRRKELRAVEPSIGEQPKVVDQEIAQIAQQRLPEDQGIGQIPAGNMDFAGGGIIAFADGGDVERYAPGGVTKAGPEFIRFLQNMGIDYTDFARMDAAGKAPIIDMFEQAKAAPTAATTSAAPAAQAAQGTSTAYNAGKAVGPYLQKAGSVLKTGALPVAGAGLAAAQGFSEVDAAQKFYDDPNVSAFEKAKQFARTGANIALPYAGGVIGSGVAPFLGTAAGAGAGMGLAAYIDDEGEALKQYRAKNEPPKGPTLAQNRGALNKADAASFATPGVDNATAAASAPSAAAPGASAAPSSVLSPSTLRSSGAGASVGIGNPRVAAGKDPFSMESIKAAQREAGGDSNYEIGAMRNQLAEMRAKADQRAQEALDRRNKEIESEGDVYKDRSDRLVERGKKLTAQKDENTGLALLNAGLAMMSTPGGFATALGKGAQVGTAQYAAGLKDLRAAQERLDEANDRIEDLRMNRKDMNKRDIRALEKDRDSVLAEGEKLTFAFAKDMYGLNRADATTAFNSYMQGQKTKYEQDQQTKRTMATISASNDGRAKQLWAGLMQKHGNDPVAAAKEYNAIEQGDKPTQAAEKLVQERIADYEKANKMALTMMTPQDREAQLKKAAQGIRNDIYTQLKLTPTMGAGASGDSRFKIVGVQPTP
jgi:hypothetical protein